MWKLLYLIPLYFGNDIIPNSSISVSPANGGLLYRYLKRRTGLSYALFGVVFFSHSHHCQTVLLGIRGPWRVILFLCLASSSFEVAESGFKRKFLIFSGVMAGLAMGRSTTPW